MTRPEQVDLAVAELAAQVVAGKTAGPADIVTVLTYVATLEGFIEDNGMRQAFVAENTPRTEPISIWPKPGRYALRADQ